MARVGPVADGSLGLDADLVAGVVGSVMRIGKTLMGYSPDLSVLANTKNLGAGTQVT